MKNNKRFIILTGAAAIVIGGALAISDIQFTGSTVAHAQQKGAGGHGEGGKKMQGGQGSAAGGQGQGAHSAEDMMHGGGASEDHGGDEEDSDRPDWAGAQGKDGKPGRGNTNPGISKGSILGDMYALLRDENGVPILNDNGFVQPVDSEGNPIPLDEEGHPLDESATVEVELGRMNVGRSPSAVLSSRLAEAVNNLNEADSIGLDEAGRITYTVDGEVKTIDSPLENLALYVKLMDDGTLGLSLDNSVLGNLSYLNDGTLTAQDVTAAASFLAGASDKYTPMTVDGVVYLNTILGVNGTIEQNDTQYVDFSNFSYDRSSTYDGVTVNVLEKVSDGTYETRTVDLYDAVFGGQEYTSDSGIDGFAQAADDARAVIAYVHDHSAPEE